MHLKTRDDGEYSAEVFRSSSIAEDWLFLFYERKNDVTVLFVYCRSSLPVSYLYYYTTPATVSDINESQIEEGSLPLVYTNTT